MNRITLRIGASPRKGMRKPPGVLAHGRRLAARGKLALRAVTCARQKEVAALR